MWQEEGKGSSAELTVEVLRLALGRCHFRLHFHARRCLRHEHGHGLARVVIAMATRVEALGDKALRSSAAPKEVRAVVSKAMVSGVVALRAVVRWEAARRAGWRVAVTQVVVSRAALI